MVSSLACSPASIGTAPTAWVGATGATGAGASSTSVDIDAEDEVWADCSTGAAAPAGSAADGADNSSEGSVMRDPPAMVDEAMVSFGS